MQKRRSYHFFDLKDYFYENFGFVKRVEVSAERESGNSFKAVVRVFVRGKWLVVKRKGSNVNSLISSAKRAMDGRLRKLRDKGKRRSRHLDLAVNFI